MNANGNTFLVTIAMPPAPTIQILVLRLLIALHAMPGLRKSAVARSQLLSRQRCLDMLLLERLAARSRQVGGRPRQGERHRLLDGAPHHSGLRHTGAARERRHEKPARLVHHEGGGPPSW